MTRLLKSWTRQHWIPGPYPLCQDRRDHKQMILCLCASSLESVHLMQRFFASSNNQSILKDISPGCSLEGHVEAEIPIFWPPDAKSWPIGKDLDAGKDWGQEEKGMTEDEMVGWHHRLNGHGFGWTPGVGDGQGGLACCNSWGHKEQDTTEWLNWTALNSFKVTASHIWDIHKVLSPMWNLWWTKRLDLLIKDFLHSLHS